MRAGWRLLPALALASCLGAMPAPAPQPRGFWHGAKEGAVPAAIAGGRTIHTEALARLLQRPKVVLIDVAPAPRRPAGMAQGAVWLPLAHRDLPGSIWIPDAGLAEAPTEVKALLSKLLAQATQGDRARPVVVYCHPNCWLSWNAAKRVIGDGYRNVYWYPDGVEGWSKSGRPTVAAQAARPDTAGRAAAP
jgi:PQQ-dependent catabolism-associated CXXCW motif protein